MFKTMKANKKRITSVIGVLFFVMAIVQGCSDVAGPNADSGLLSDNYEGAALAETCVAESSATIYAGKNAEVGEVIYSVDDTNVYITYVADAGYAFTETHLWVGTDLANLPTAGNNAPKNGHFPYGETFGTPQTTWSQTIPLIDLGLASGDDLTDLYIVAHAVVGELKNGSVKKTETGYAGEEEGDSKRWWYYIHLEEFEECEEGGGGIGGTGGGNR